MRLIALLLVLFAAPVYADAFRTTGNHPYDVTNDTGHITAIELPYIYCNPTAEPWPTYTTVEVTAWVTPTVQVAQDAGAAVFWWDGGSWDSEALTALGFDGASWRFKETLTLPVSPAIDELRFSAAIVLPGGDSESGVYGASIVPEPGALALLALGGLALLRRR